VTQQRREHARWPAEIRLREVPTREQFIAECLGGDMRVRVATDESQRGNVVQI